MSSREPINLDDTTMDVLLKMAEGNPGAITVLSQLLERDDPTGLPGLLTILSLDDMNMRGPQIWVGYKDHCGEDIEAFAAAVNSRDPEMIATVNAESGVDERAVPSGAAFNLKAGRGMGLGT